MVGEGTYGVVFKAVIPHDGTLVAVKKYRLDKGKNLQLYKTATRELAILRALRHINIVTFLEAFTIRDRLHLVFEYVSRTGEGTRLTTWLRCLTAT